MNTTSTNTRKIATCATIVLAGTLVLSACSGGETIKGTEISSSSSGTAQATERIRDLGFNTKDATVEDSGAWQTHDGQGMTLKVHSSGDWEVRNSQNTKVLDVKSDGSWSWADGPDGSITVNKDRSWELSGENGNISVAADGSYDSTGKKDDFKGPAKPGTPAKPDNSKAKDPAQPISPVALGRAKAVVK